VEELQSTEILDREILEDARKKAHRILKAADEMIQVKTTEWEQKLAGDLDELEKKYAQQMKFSADEIMARLPIDKHRVKIKKIEMLLDSAAAAWHENLSREYVLDLLAKELAKRLTVKSEIKLPDSIHIFIHKMTQTEAQTILKAVLPDTSFVFETLHSVSAYPELIVDMPELRIYASIDKIIHYYLSEKRAELVEALLGESAGEEW